ncbi:hypothetical protein J4206_01075 [Candidatus Woesearchaeota archaeon]|nr:hypothetical protein [Candidatus Woesearchaeota archaeon]
MGNGEGTSVMERGAEVRDASSAPVSRYEPEWLVEDGYGHKLPRFTLDLLVVADSEVPDSRSEERTSDDAEGKTNRTDSPKNGTVRQSIVDILMKYGSVKQNYEGHIAVAYPCKGNIIGDYIIYSNPFNGEFGRSNTVKHRDDRTDIAVMESVATYLNVSRKQDYHGLHTPVIIGKTHSGQLQKHLEARGLGDLVRVIPVPSYVPSSPAKDASRN